MLSRFYLFIFVTFLSERPYGQDIHFADVRSSKLWYNPALKTNREVQLQAGFRSVKYQDITAYTSSLATIEIPLMIDNENKTNDNGGFMNLGIGMTQSSSTGGTMKVSAAMGSISYALLLNEGTTWLAAGFQAAYNFSRVNYNGYNSFPDKFDQYGPISSAVLADPYGSGYTYQYFTAGAGTALFHNGEKRQWYIGGSLRHLNRPLADPTQPSSYRLPVNLGAQGGYSKNITDQDAVTGYANMTWQHHVHEHVMGIEYTRSLADSARSAVSMGLGYRVGDALMPSVSLGMGKHHFFFCYEFDIARRFSGYYGRRSIEFFYTLNL